jgi:hypothetical protein
LPVEQIQDAVPPLQLEMGKREVKDLGHQRGPQLQGEMLDVEARQYPAHIGKGKGAHEAVVHEHGTYAQPGIVREHAVQHVGTVLATTEEQERIVRSRAATLRLGQDAIQVLTDAVVRTCSLRSAT